MNGREVPILIMIGSICAIVQDTVGWLAFLHMNDSFIRFVDKERAPTKQLKLR